MKSNRLSPVLAMMLTFVMTSMLISPTLAASTYDGGSKKNNSPKKLTAIRADILNSVKNRDIRDQFSSDELEQMRSALLELLDANQLISTLLPSGDKADKSGFQIKASEFDEARTQIQQMSAKDLTTFRKGLNPSIMRARIANSRIVLTEFKDGLAQHTPGSPDSPGLPGINSYCGAPVDTGVIIAADVVYFTAEGVRDIAQDGCNEVLVIAGEGGNARAVCLATDAVYLIAKALNQGIHFCDDDYAASVGQASFDRLGHIHSDLEDSVTNDNTNTTTLDTHATTNTTNIISNDNANRVTIVNNDNANALALTNLVNAALTQIISNANANKDETKNILLRTQIEADLASVDGSAFVGLYETPTTTCFASLNSFGLPQSGIPSSTTQCGLLDLVRSIVAQTVANVGAGTNAQTYLNAGDTFRTAGRFKSAYNSYKQAYKAAVK
jgi:hypothetical protein